MANENQVEQQAQLVELLQKANELGKQYNDILQSQYEIMQRMFQVDPGALDRQTQGVKTLSDAISSLNDENQNLESGLSDQNDALKDIFDSTEDASRSFNKFTSILRKAPPLIAFVTSLGKTFLFLKTATTSVASVITGFIGTVFRLGLSLLALPIGIMNELFKEAQTGGSNEFRRQLEEIRKTFGDLSRNESRAIIDGFRNIRGELAQTGLSSYRILGNMAERLQFVAETARHMGVAFSLVRNQVAAHSEQIAAYIKGLGLSDNAQKAIAARSVATGVSITELGRQMTTYAYQVGEAFGFNGKQISRDVGEMMGDISNFGNLSIQTLTNVAVYARKLGVEVSKLTGAIGAFDNFEKAAESVAQLSQAFGLQLDTFALVQEQDPAARIEQLRKSFFAAGQSIESMNRQQRALLATQTGLDQETLALVFSQKSASTSYADIQRKSEQARKQQLTQAEAMEKLSNSIERLVKDGQALQGGLFDILFAGFAAGVRRSWPFRHLMMSIRRLMRQVFRTGREMGRMFVELFPGVKTVFNSLAQYLSPGGIGRHFRVLKEQFREFLTGLTPQNAGRRFTQFIDNVRQNFLGALQGPGLASLRQGLLTFGQTINTIAAEMIRYIGQGLTRALNSVAQFIRNPTEFLNTLRQGAETAGGGLMSVLMPLADAFMDVAPALWAAIMDVFSAIFDRVKDSLLNFAMQHWPSLLGVLFGPSILSASLAAISQRFIGTFATAGLQVLSGGFQRLIGGAASSIAGGPIASMLSGLTGATAGAEAAANAATSSPTLTNPASVGKMIAVGAAIGVGLVAFVAGMVALALLIRSQRLTAADIGLTTLAMTAAVGIATAIGGAMSLLLPAITAIQASAAQITVGLVAVGAVGAALAFGMLQLVDVFRGVGITEIGITSAAMVAAIGVATLIGLALAGLGVAAAPALIGSAAALIAVPAIGLVGNKLAELFLELNSKLGQLPMGQIVTTGTVMVTTLGIVASIATSMGILAGVGALSLLAPVIAVGLYAIETLADSLKTSMLAITTSTAALSVSILQQTTEKFAYIALLVTGLAAIGTALAAAALPLSLAARFGGVTSDAIREITNNVVSSISTLIERLSTIQTDEATRQKLTLFINVIRAVIDFGRTMTGLLETGSIFEGIGNRVRAINSLVRHITDGIRNIVSNLITVAQELVVTEDLQSRISIITNILSAVGNFGQAITATSLEDEDAIEAMAPLVQNMMNGMTAFMVAAMPKITEMISVIANANISNENAAAITALGQIIETVFSSVGSVIRSITQSFTRQGSLLADTENLSRNGPSIGNAIASAVRGIFGGNNLFRSVSDFISGIVSVAMNINNEDLGKINAISGMIGPIFNAIAAIGIAVSNLGNIAISGNESDFANLQRIVSVISGGITSELSTLVSGIVEVLGNIDSRAAATISRSASVIGQVFSAINELFTAISTYGSAEGGTASATTIQNGFRNVAEALFGNANSQWSLRSFVSLFNPGGSMAQLNAAIETNMATVEAARTSIGTFKTSISEVFGVVDSQFTTGLTQGLTSTLQHVNTTLTDIISKINEVHTKINQAGRAININAALANLGETIGTANPERLQIARGDLTINVNVQVVLDVDDIEEAIATRNGGSTFVVSKEATTRRTYLTSATPTYPG